MKTIIKNGRVIDPSQNLDDFFDLCFENGKIVALEKTGKLNDSSAQIVDAKNQIVTPGFVELHAHLREPGHEYKETIATGARAAVAGGYTSVCCMANTNPPNDTAVVTNYILQKAREAGLCRVYPIGAITKGLKGEEFAPLGELQAAGCVAISDDGWTVQDAQMMRMGLERWVQREPVLVKSKAFRIKLIYTFLRLQNRWQALVHLWPVIKKF